MDGSSRELMMEASIINTHVKCIIVIDISLDYKLQLIVKCTARCSVMTVILTQCTYTISAVALIILLGS